MTMIKESPEAIAKYFKTIHKVPEFLVGQNISHENVRYLKLGSVANYAKFMREVPVAGKHVSSRNNDENKWSGTRNWNEYLTLLDKGDDKVMNAIKTATKKSANELEKKYEDVISGYKFDVAGEFFDIGLVLSGVPECWLEPEYKIEETPRVTINIDGGYLSDVTPEEVVTSAGRIIAMGKVLEDMGVEVRLDLFNLQNHWRAEGEQELLVTAMTIKDFDEPINYRKLSSVITPAHFRRGFFNIMEQISTVIGGYGRQDHLKTMVRIDDYDAITRLEKNLFKGRQHD